MKNLGLLVCFVCLMGWFLVGCNLSQDQAIQTEIPEAQPTSLVNPAPTDTPLPPSHLTICLQQEPRSLFIYGDFSKEANLVRQAIYDGPVDLVNGENIPVILEKIPFQADGDVFFEPVEMQPGAVLVDTWGKLVRLENDVSYFPSGCQDFSCVQTFTGTETVLVDRQVVRFTLKGGIQWSDGSELSADDSLYAFELTQALYPKVGADTLPFTGSYQVVDPYTIEWRSMPGFVRGDYLKFFFHPLPRHAWGKMSTEELFTAESSTQRPLGWGAFVMDEWLPGEEIVLSKNPNYFRVGEGLPKIDRLTYRFIPSQAEALEALSAGECDLLSPSYAIEANSEQRQVLEQNPEVQLAVFETTQWEHLNFGIASLNPELPAIFQSKITRQAIATCIDRQQIIAETPSASANVPNSYLPAAHPRYHAGVRSYPYDPAAAAALFDAAGWLDLDANPATARTAQGVVGVEDGAPLAFVLLTTPEEERQKAAISIQASLADCGVQVQIEALPAEQLFLSGPEGRVFGRQFQMVQFSWAGGDWPLCNLFTSQEIPGDYPQFSKGWGGANLSGYSNPDYDQACVLAQRALLGTPESSHQAALVQSIFSEDLPMVPLYFRQATVAAKADLCGPLTDPVSGFTLWNLEGLSVNGDCAK